jgi:sodium/bile acid cotransporter 7
MTRPRFLPDNFTLCLLVTVTLASLWPAQGAVAQGFELLTTAAIALLFFLHGAKLSRAAVVAGLSHWRLHLLVCVCTFVLFPVLGLLLKPAFSLMLTPDLAVGMLFLCTLPATVQSAIAFTAMARGNVSAAVCSASASSLIGVFITPLLVGWLVVPGGVSGSGELEAVGRIMLQLMLPFVAGQLLQPWIGGFVKKHAAGLKFVDLHPAGGLHRLQCRCDRGPVEAGAFAYFAWPGGRLLPVAGLVPVHDHMVQPHAGLQHRR